MTRRRRYGPASLVIASWLIVSPAKARDIDPYCAAPDEIATTLSREFGERPLLTGRAHDGGRMTLWVNPESRSWSIVLISGDGSRACIGAVGGEALPASVGPATRASLAGA